MTPADLRVKAVECRTRAKRVADPETRLHLRHIANQLEDVAAELEGRTRRADTETAA